jgi:hypothetical protein
MPLESLRCTNCGSGDLQQVKPGTYFCSHCESLSRLADPPRVIVEQTFCEHGDPFVARCQICGAGLCAGACDAVVQDQEDRRRGQWTRLPTIGFGYLQKAKPRGETPIVQDGTTIVTEGPFLVRRMLIHSLQLIQGQVLRHVCRTCLMTAVPGAAEHITSGVVCENPQCITNGRTLSPCACCESAFCDHCVSHGNPPEWMNHGDDNATCRTGVFIEYGSLSDRVLSTEVIVPLRQGRYCLQCKYELARRVKDSAGKIAERVCGAVLTQKHGTSDSPDSRPVFQVSSRRKATWRRQLAENSRARETAEKHAAEIGSAIGQSLVGCRKREQFEQTGGYRSWFEYTLRYLILDERSRIPAAAAEKA